MPTENEPFNATIFSKEQFNVVLRYHLPSFSKQFFHFTKILLSFLHPNVVKVLMGYSILDMLFHLDLSLLKVFFIYIVKMSRKWIFSLSAYIISLQLVMELSDSTKDSVKGHVIVSGPWAGSIKHPDREFEPCCSLVIPGRIDHSSFLFYPYSFINCRFAADVYCFVCYRK